MSCEHLAKARKEAKKNNTDRPWLGPLQKAFFQLASSRQFSQILQPVVTTQHGRYGGNYRNQTPAEDPNRGKPLNREPERRLNAIEEGDEQWDDKEAGLNTIAGRREPPWKNVPPEEKER